MWVNRSDVKKMIKKKQREMYTLVNEKGINDPDVYSKSCELDCLIVDYMKKYNNFVANSFFNNC